MIRREWRNIVKDTQGHNSFASVGSDHKILSIKLKLSLRSNTKAATRKIRYDWKRLSAFSDLQEQYTLKVKNKFHEQTNEDNSAKTKYSNLIEANEEAAENLLPVIKCWKRKQIAKIQE